MKILIISSGILPVPPVKGGAVENLIDLLLQENEKNNKIEYTVCSIYSNEAIKGSKNYKNTNFIFINKNNIRYKLKRNLKYLLNRIPTLYFGNAYITEIKRIVNFDIYDWVIVENCPEYASLIYEKAKGKLILHLHNDRLNLKTKNAKRILSMYEKILVLSKYIGEQVNKIQPENNDKIYTLYNGIDIKRFEKEQYINEIENTKKQFGINEQDKVILYTGRLVPEKGVKELLQAFKKIQSKSCKLLIAGSVDYGKTSVSKYIKELRNISENNKNIIFTGYVSYEEIPKIYSVADIGIVPSVWEEPFALTVIEHMAAGHPVIVSDSGGIPELINKDCAIMVHKKENYIENLKKAIEDLVNNDEKRKNMSKAAIIQANKFNKERYCETFFEIIKK